MTSARLPTGWEFCPPSKWPSGSKFAGKDLAATNGPIVVRAQIRDGVTMVCANVKYGYSADAPFDVILAVVTRLEATNAQD